MLCNVRIVSETLPCPINGSRRSVSLLVARPGRKLLIPCHQMTSTMTPHFLAHLPSLPPLSITRATFLLSKGGDLLTRGAMFLLLLQTWFGHILCTKMYHLCDGCGAHVGHFFFLQFCDLLSCFICMGAVLAKECVSFCALVCMCCTHYEPNVISLKTWQGTVPQHVYSGITAQKRK